MNTHDQQNSQAWNEKSYEAWTHRFGTPEKAAAKIKKDPVKRLAPLDEYMGDVRGKKVANLLGSHGSKAVALSLLGAAVTVIDLSEPNERYAKELAAAADTPLRYVRSDVLQLPAEELTGDYDIVLTENGILHYFSELEPFFTVIAQLLKPGGTLVLQDFHPVSTKLISSQGKSQGARKHRVDGDYFSTALETTDISYAKFLPELRYATEEERKPYQVAIRKWTLGEIVTAAGQARLLITDLKEEGHPGDFDHGIPKTFIMKAERL